MTINMDKNDPKEIVRRGYDQISHAYRGDSISRDRGYFTWIDELIPLLQPGDAVLDLGCGCGIPVAQELAQNYQVTGVDLSEVQIERANQLVPQATFICADMTTLRFPPATFTAVLSFFAIIHLPLQEQRPLLERTFTWLKPGGYLMATVGYQAWTGTNEAWYGAPMYWSTAGEATYLTWLQEIGFSLLWTRFIPEGDGGHVLILGRRPSP
jgi:ubiquinone/menaquinone biosynthesis C-methylase UbiE